MKFMLLLGLIGHIFCGASDCLLTYAPNGKVNLTDFKDYEKSRFRFGGCRDGHVSSICFR